MTGDEALRYFAKAIPQIQVIGLHSALYTNGSAKDVLQRLGRAYQQTYRDTEAQWWDLPWYHDGHRQQVGWWHPKARPLSIRDWLLWVWGQNRRIDGFVHGKLRYWLNATDDNSPALVVSDTAFDKTVIVDGVHRTLARILKLKPLPCVVYESKWAHILWPYHFLNHAVAGAV